MTPTTSFTRWQFARFLMGWSFYVMLTLMVIEALLGALTTYLVIQAGRHVANHEFLIFDPSFTGGVFVG